MRPTRIRDKEMYEDEYTESEFEETNVQDVEGRSDDDIYDADDDIYDALGRDPDDYRFFNVAKYFCGL